MLGLYLESLLETGPAKCSPICLGWFKSKRMRRLCRRGLAPLSRGCLGVGSRALALPATSSPAASGSYCLAADVVRDCPAKTSALESSLSFFLNLPWTGQSFRNLGGSLSRGSFPASEAGAFLPAPFSGCSSSVRGP